MSQLDAPFTITGVLPGREFVAVRFGNGDLFTLSYPQLLAGESVVQKLKFVNGVPDVSLSGQGVSLVFHGDPTIELNWIKIRRVADPAFGEYFKLEATRQAAWFGTKLKGIRESVQFTVTELASKAGLTVPELLRIEDGTVGEVNSPIVAELLRCMGRSPVDLAS